MGRLDRFTAPVVDRLALSDGDWIEVKSYLNTGEVKQLEAAGLVMRPDDTGKMVATIDWGIYELERATIFVTDWSLRNSDDKPVPFTMAALRALDIDTFKEINTAVYNHVGSQAAKKAQRKAEKTLPAETPTAPGTAADTSSTS